jgi:ankyrin repeat protein
MEEPPNKLMKISENENEKNENEKNDLDEECEYSPLHFSSIIKSKNINHIKSYLSLINILRNEHSIISILIKETSSFSYSSLNIIIEILNNKGVNFNLVNNMDNTPLRCSIMNCNIPMIRNLINIKVNLDNKFSLHLAIIHLNIEIVKELLNAGANPNLQDNEGNTPIMLAAFYHNTEIFDLLFNLNVNIDLSLKNNKGWTALIAACNNDAPVYCSNKEIITKLIEKGSLINEIDNNGNTALNMISNNINDYTKLIIIILLEAGADPDIADNMGDTPLINIARSNYITSIHNIISCMIHITNYGANLNHKNKYNETIYTIMDTEIKEYFEICATFSKKQINQKIFINRNCLICDEKENKMVYLDVCQHIIMCFKCFQQLQNYSIKNDTSNKCPLCNTNIGGYRIVEYMNE